MKRLLTMMLALMLCIAAGAQTAKALYDEGKAYYDAEQYDKAVPKQRRG